MLRQIGKYQLFVNYEKSNNSYYCFIGDNLPTECTESNWISDGGEWTTNGVCHGFTPLASRLSHRCGMHNRHKGTVLHRKEGWGEIEAGMLNEIVVSKTRPKTKLLGDAVVTTVAGSILEHAGNSLEVLAKVPGMISKNGNLEVIGRGTPIYYINGRKVTDDSELRNLMSEDIKSIDVVSNPGAEYGGEVRCVVRVRTVKRQGDGFSYALTSQALQHIYDNHDTDLCSASRLISFQHGKQQV